MHATHEQTGYSGVWCCSRSVGNHTLRLNSETPRTLVMESKDGMAHGSSTCNGIGRGQAHGKPWTVRIPLPRRSTPVCLCLRFESLVVYWKKKMYNKFITFSRASGSDSLDVWWSEDADRLPRSWATAQCQCLALISGAWVHIQLFEKKKKIFWMDKFLVFCHPEVYWWEVNPTLCGPIRRGSSAILPPTVE